MRYPALLLAALLLLSGCFGTTPSDSSPTDAVSPAPAPSSGASDVSPTPRSPPQVQADEGVDGSTVPLPDRARRDRPEVFREFAVGDPATKRFDGRTIVSVWNAGPNRTLDVTMSYGRDNTTILDRRIRFPADERLAFGMYRSGSYTVTITHANGSRTVALPPGNFDCNDQSHWLWLDETGGVRESSSTTLLRCSTPTG